MSGRKEGTLFIIGVLAASALLFVFARQVTGDFRFSFVVSAVFAYIVIGVFVLGVPYDRDR